MSRTQAAVGWVLVLLVAALFVGQPSGMHGSEWVAGGVLIGWSIISALVARVIARRNGWHRSRAAALGFLFGWLGVLVVYVLSRRRRTRPVL